MVRFILEYRLDAVAFVVALWGGAVAAHVLLRRRHGRGVPWGAWGVLAVLAAVGGVAPEVAGEHERGRLRDMLSGIAPTYAQEMELLGHARMALDTPADDPLYLSMVHAEMRWQRVNPNVNDVYTFRRLADGRVVLIVDSETDYDRDGQYSGEREQRTAVGEEYKDVTDALRRAFDGVATFDGIPYNDRWGTWVSAYVPMRGPDGKVEAVLGVDYDARRWETAIAWNRAAALGFVSVLTVILIASTVVVAVTRAELRARTAAEKERERLQAELVLASRQAGMAEVATGVLHNVGNVLNSVNVSAGVLADRLRTSKVPALNRAAGMIRENRGRIGEFLTADARGKVLPDYLVQLAGLLGAEQEEMVRELGQLAQSVDHIKHIVAAQQTFAKMGGDVAETLDLAGLLDDAVRLDAQSIERHGVEVRRTVGACGPVRVDRHKALQILVNLVSNAKKAVRDNEAGRRVISLDVGPAADEDGRPVARVTVADTGVGIDPANLSKIFTHGFTTRKDGHGFGLHFSAIAARQMGGRLVAASGGAGRGATFTLDIPLSAPAAATPTVAAPPASTTQAATTPAASEVHV